MSEPCLLCGAGLPADQLSLVLGEGGIGTGWRHASPSGWSGSGEPDQAGIDHEVVAVAVALVVEAAAAGDQP